MRTDAEREERAIGKLEHGRATVRRAGAGYVVTGPNGAESMVADLVARGACADAVDDRVWTGTRITPSA